MSLAGLARLIPAGWKGETRALVDLLADRHAFEASPSQRDEIARRADAFLSSLPIDGEAAQERKFDLVAGDWKTRAEAAARLSADGAWTPWTLTGSLGIDDAEGARDRDGARLASAVLIAARETLLPGISGRHERLRGTASAALKHEKEGGRHWDEAARHVLGEFAANARAHGADRRTAALQALSAAAHLKGRRMASGAGGDPFLLGAASSVLLRGEADAGDEAPFMKGLVEAVTASNVVRLAMWDDADAETTRLLGASASFAAFGRGEVSAPRPFRKNAPPAHLPSGLDHFAHLTASEAASAIDDAAADPRLGEGRRRRLAGLSEALRGHPASHAVSCAEALGRETPEVRKADFKPGMSVYRAAVDGRRRPLVCEGRHGRAVRCRAVAAPDGALVGYLAFDALSREFGGRPLYAAYALDGNRYGYAWADGGRPVIRRGRPEQGFMTAPERIPA